MTAFSAQVFAHFSLSLSLSLSLASSLSLSHSLLLSLTHTHTHSLTHKSSHAFSPTLADHREKPKATCLPAFQKSSEI